MDYFLTIDQPASGLYKEKGSKFISYIFYVDSEEAVSSRLSEVKKEHFKARHHCYAYRLGTTDNHWRASDDGEPSGSAGKPIFNQILSSQLRNVLIVVVRYFGGTKLGVSGLIRAYKASSADAISNGQIIKQEVTIDFVIAFDYSILSEVMAALKSLNININNQSMETTAKISFGLKPSNYLEKIHSFSKLVNGLSPKSVEEILWKTDLYEINQVSG